MDVTFTVLMLMARQRPKFRELNRSAVLLWLLDYDAASLSRGEVGTERIRCGIQEKRDKKIRAILVPEDIRRLRIFWRNFRKELTHVIKNHGGEREFEKILSSIRSHFDQVSKVNLGILSLPAQSYHPRYR
jgi:hypothetical protein